MRQNANSAVVNKMSEMSHAATCYVFAVIALAFLVIGLDPFTWHSGVLSFLGLLALCSATSVLKVGLPGMSIHLSASFLVLIWAIVRLGSGEVYVLGWASILVQSHWKCKRKPALVQLVFNLAVVSLSISSARLVLQGELTKQFVPQELYRLVLASAAYFAVNSFTLCGVIALTKNLSVWSVWRESYLWSFPHYLLSASVVGAVEMIRKYIGFEVAFLILPVAYFLYHTYQMHLAALNRVVERAEQEKRHAAEANELHLRTIRALALAIEAKDQTTGDHLHRVQTYALALGKELNLSVEELEGLGAAAILHDVGKLAVPEYIISKPGKLTPEEFAKMKTHTVVGSEIVESVHFPFSVAPLVRAHHEKWNGTGYPDGLKGEEIPIGARILSAVDCLDALASDRQYRKAMPLEKAMSIVIDESGKSFDPQVVDALKLRYKELEAQARTTLRTGDVKLSIDMVVHCGFGPDAGYAVGSMIEGRKIGLLADGVAKEVTLLDCIYSSIGKFESVEDDVLAIEKQLRSLIPYDGLALYRKKNETVECSMASGEGSSSLLGITIPLGVGASGWVAANRTPLLNGVAATEFGVTGNIPVDFKLSSSLAIPLESEYGTIGVLTLYSLTRESFESCHLRMLLAISSKLAHQLHLEMNGVKRERIPAVSREEQSLSLQLERLSDAVGGNLNTPSRVVQP